jgi:nitric oxide reductase subunit B
MVFFMVLLVLSLAIAGVVQVYVNRILGLDFLTAQGFMRLWFACFWIAAWGFTVGAAIFIWDFFTRVRAARVAA